MFLCFGQINYKEAKKHFIKSSFFRKRGASRSIFFPFGSQVRNVHEWPRSVQLAEALRIRLRHVQKCRKRFFCFSAHTCNSECARTLDSMPGKNVTCKKNKAQSKSKNQRHKVVCCVKKHAVRLCLHPISAHPPTPPDHVRSLDMLFKFRAHSFIKIKIV